MQTLSRLEARRLALARAGLLKPEWTGFPRRARGGGPAARRSAEEVVRRLGYLQLDAVSVAGARSHALVLLSRLAGLDAELPETLLRPGTSLFEYWGHEASWIPLELYPHLGFRRRQYRVHPWWGPVLQQHRSLARRVLARVRSEGPIRSADLEDVPDRPGSWGRTPTRRVLHALWSSGALAVRERRGFQRFYDLAERVIPGWAREARVAEPAGLDELLLRALAAQGWASLTTLARTWRLTDRRPLLERRLRRLERRGRVTACALADEAGATPGWVLAGDLELAARLARLRPLRERGVLLSPFDTLLWDRARVQRLFGFDQRLEIYKPGSQRVYGYYVLPVLAGERLVARADLRAERQRGVLRVLSLRFETAPRVAAADRAAARAALARLGRSLKLAVRSA